ncbi:acyl-CoA N-acyltransferase [Xylaria sp. CBS 124048]|nr:acyl-CoA N-acyltransferase [Xylaria sp. CBS 124048]
MSLPSNTNGQSSIRSFFRPQQPIHASPPSASKSDNDKKQSSPSSTSPPLPPTSITPTATNDNTTTTPALSHRPANLHPQASIECIKPEHVQALRRITSLLLPVTYPDSFYARLSDPQTSGAFSRVILWRDDRDDPAAPAKVIGGLVCRPEPSPFHIRTLDSHYCRLNPAPNPPQPNALYIQSLVLLSPYRGLGLAAALLDEVITDAAHSAFACETVWAHVWTQNEEALRWYVARGFARVEEVKKYYFKLQPDSAWIVRREIGPTAALRRNRSSAPSFEPDPHDRGEILPSVTAAVANLRADSPLSNSNASNPLSPPPRTQSKSQPLPSTTATIVTPSRPPLDPLTPSARSTPGQSFQNMRPETEWNDLPSDMQPLRSSPGSLSVPGGTGTASSAASSRSSSSTGRKRRDRAYPAAAFGN